MKTREQVADILREIKDLPTLPAVATRVISMTDDPNCSQQELAKVVELDPAIATKLLKLVNSPFYGIRGAIGSVQQALVFVGMTNIRNLVLSASVMELFDEDGCVGDFSRKDLWLHSMATAISARTIAVSTRTVDPEVAFTAGLIHDVGKLIIDRFFHEDFVRIVELLKLHSTTMSNVENAVLGLDHGEIGAYVAQRWGLPDVLRDAIGFHHDPANAPTGKQLAALIGLADGMARDLKVGTGGGETPKLNDEQLEIAGMSRDSFSQVKERLAENIGEHVSQMASV
jgi:putative nucleotidyltransferase with HDIG domain